MNITFINYHRACVAQGVNRKTERPYYGYFQPYGAYIALAIQFVLVLAYGYYAFRPKFDVEVFFQNYSMQILAVLLFVGWKVFKKTKYTPSPLLASGLRWLSFACLASSTRRRLLLKYKCLRIIL